MATMPLLVSVPHAGLGVPSEVRPYCVLTEQQIHDDSDGGAAEIYGALEPEVVAFVTTDVARAIVDVNRSENDRSRDGAIKTHTSYDVPVYREPLPWHLADQLIARYHRPYRAKLSALASSGAVVAIDCHTMAHIAPPNAPDAGRERPLLCLSNADGTCPRAWLDAMAECLEKAFGRRVSINSPYQGGNITRMHSCEMPWMQIEVSRTAELSNAEKRRGVEDAFKEYCRRNASRSR